MEMTVHEDVAAQESKWIDRFQGTNLLRTMISIGGFACQHFTGIIFFVLDTRHTCRGSVTAAGVAGNMLSLVVNRYRKRKVFVHGMFVLTALLLLIGIMDVVPRGAAKCSSSLHCHICFHLLLDD
jgi:hypothetical protein